MKNMVTDSRQLKGGSKLKVGTTRGAHKAWCVHSSAGSSPASRSRLPSPPTWWASEWAPSSRQKACSRACTRMLPTALCAGRRRSGGACVGTPPGGVSVGTLRSGEKSATRYVTAVHRAGVELPRSKGVDITTSGLGQYETHEEKGCRFLMVKNESRPRHDTWTNIVVCPAPTPYIQVQPVSLHYFFFTSSLGWSVARSTAARSRSSPASPSAAAAWGKSVAPAGLPPAFLAKRDANWHGVKWLGSWFRSMQTSLLA